MAITRRLVAQHGATFTNAVSIQTLPVYKGGGLHIYRAVVVKIDRICFCISYFLLYYII